MFDTHTAVKVRMIVDGIVINETICNYIDLNELFNDNLSLTLASTQRGEGLAIIDDKRNIYFDCQVLEEDVSLGNAYHSLCERIDKGEI